MSTKVVIGNLPAGTQIEEVRELLIGRGWPLLGLSPVPGDDPDRLAFLAEVDVDPHTAKMMEARAGDHFFKGRKVSLFVPTLAR